MAFLDLQYFSDAIGMQTSAYVILPQTAPPPFRVLFLLHGRSDNHTIWMRRTSIERYVEGSNWLVVMPNGNRSFYVDEASGYRYGEAIGVELPKLIKKWFHTEDRFAISGLSMGGYGAVRLALAHPESFKSAVSHSGALLKFDVGISEARAHEEPEWRRIFGASPSGGPADIYALASKEINRIPIRMDCGTEDFLLNENRWFHAHLRSVGYEHEYEEYPGAHTWDYWDRHVSEGIAFHERF
jgi:S-formylglutathione hydrolase FrmB